MRIDYLNNTITITDYLDRIIVYNLYTFNILTETHSDVNKWENTYDENGKKTNRIFPNGSKWVYRYGKSGKILSAVHSSGEMIEYEYDYNGNFLTKKFSKLK